MQSGIEPSSITICPNLAEMKRKGTDSTRQDTSVPRHLYDEDRSRPLVKPSSSLLVRCRKPLKTGLDTLAWRPWSGQPAIRSPERDKPSGPVSVIVVKP